MNVRVHASAHVRQKPDHKTTSERRFSMNKAWTQILVPLLIAATEAILEVIKVLKKKGKTVS